MNEIDESDDLHEDDRGARELDDFADRDELRRRYFGLMQELRILLPGVQILVAFLLTSPFSARFAELDGLGASAYWVALGAGCASVVTFGTPVVMHRVGDRRARATRLVWSVACFRVGLAGFGIALVSALMVVAELVGSNATAIVVGAVALSFVLLAWVVVPLVVAPRTKGRPDSRT